MGRGSNISAEERKAVIDLYKQGKTIDYIVLKSGRSDATVYRILNSAGVRQPKKANRVYKKKHKPTPEKSKKPDTEKKEEKKEKKEPCNGFTSTKTLFHYYIYPERGSYFIAVSGECLYGTKCRTQEEAQERLEILKEILEQNGVACIVDLPLEGETEYGYTYSHL